MIVTVGGTIPADDVEELKALGVAEVFTPGASTQQRRLHPRRRPGVRHVATRVSSHLVAPTVTD